MRLQRLDLKAFGSFSDHSIDFQTKTPGLHIIYGPNEAGKSTSLRALKALLYGFPERTTDNFIHPNNQLLVGGTIEDREGKQLQFVRRKKRKADLLDLDGNVLDPLTMAGFLHGIDPGLFESLYGIDYETLVQGGEDILAQKGDVGQALFAAGSGITSLRNILLALDLEAEDLFKPRGSKQEINQAISRYKVLKKELTAASLPSKRWHDHQNALQAAEDTKVRLEQESREKSSEIQRLARLQKIIPELAHLDNLNRQLALLTDIVQLPADFSDQLHRVEQQIREKKLQNNNATERLEKLLAFSKTITLNRKILEQRGSVEDLHQRLGEYRKGLKDRDRLDGMRITHRKDGAAILKEIRPDLNLDQAEKLHPLLRKRKTIQTLLSRYEVLNNQASQIASKKAVAEKELQNISKLLAALPSVTNADGLTKAIRLATKAGDLDRLINTDEREITAGEISCRTELTRLGHWSGSLEQLLQLPLPLLDTIKLYESRFTEISDQKRQLSSEQRDLEGNLQTALAEKKRLDYGGKVPGEQDLTESRNKRDQGWQLLRSQWLDGEDTREKSRIYDAILPLPEAYEKYIELADHIGDRLRREADRVANAAALRARIETLKQQLQSANTRQEKLDQVETTVTAEWQAEWSKSRVTPLSPREMLGWINEVDKLRIRIQGIFHIKDEHQQKVKERSKFQEILLGELTAIGEKQVFEDQDLSPVLVFAETLLDSINSNTLKHLNLNEKQTQIQLNLDTINQEKQDIQTALNSWKKEWQTTLATLELTEAIRPEEALDLLESISQCLKKITGAEDFQSRITGIDRDVEKFTTDIHTLMHTAAPELAEQSIEQTVLQLQSLLAEARQQKELLKKNNEEIQAVNAEIKNTQIVIASLGKEMVKLLSIAGCLDPDDLPEVIRKSAEKQRLLEKISDAQASAAKISDGIDLTILKQEAEAIEVDKLPGLIANLQQQIEQDIYPQIIAASKVIGEESRELQALDGTAKAAEAAEEMEQVSARIRRLVNQYGRLKLSAFLLKQEIERYREAHQDPVLQIASGLFATMTLGSFSALRTDINDHDLPILIGVREDNSRLEVTAMSSGTRDQLYLALRLATLEWRLKTGEPMPFIVDDILINFDDDRSRATLQILSDLSARNQVLLFTHHREVVEAAEDLTGEGETVIHNL